jgi:hypothetical protein
MASISAFLTATSLIDIVPLSDWSTPTLTEPPVWVELPVAAGVLLSLLLPQETASRAVAAVTANTVLRSTLRFLNKTLPLHSIRWMSSDGGGPYETGRVTVMTGDVHSANGSFTDAYRILTPPIWSSADASRYPLVQMVQETRKKSVTLH